MNEYSRLKRAMRFYEEANLEKLERATTQEEKEKRIKRVEAISRCKEIMAEVKQFNQFIMYALTRVFATLTLINVTLTTFKGELLLHNVCINTLNEVKNFFNTY